MEREILIANTKTQKRSKITADVSTLGELKAALDAEGINYSGMSFTEGISNVQLNDDNSQLPHDLNYKGTVTNNLVIILTNTTKNIASGATGERAELFLFIKANSLQDKVIETFGRNMTQVPTASLADFVKRYKEVKSPVAEEQPEDTKQSEVEAMADDILSQFGFNETKEAEPKEETADVSENLSDLAINVIKAMVRYFSEAGIISYEEDCETIIKEIETVLD